MRQLKNFKSGELNESAQDALNKYKGLNEDQLIERLMQSVESGKRDGTYSDEEMAAFVNFIAPHLDDAQKERLDALVKIISGS